MNFSDILKSVAGPLASVAASLIPGGPLILKVINEVLPDDKQLGSDATGQQIADAVESLPPEARASLMEKRIDLDIAVERGMTERYQAMAASDGQETRARIVTKAMNALIGITAAFVAATVYVYATSGAEVAFSGEMAAVFGVITGTFAYVVRAYFGDLRTEAKSRHQTVDDKAQPMGVIASLLSRKLK